MTPALHFSSLTTPINFFHQDSFPPSLYCTSLHLIPLHFASFTSLHFTSHHSTSLCFVHFTSLHLIPLHFASFTSLHLIPLHFASFTSPHSTSFCFVHFTSLHLIPLHFASFISLHFTSFHFTLLRLFHFTSHCHYLRNLSKSDTVVFGYVDANETNQLFRSIVDFSRNTLYVTPALTLPHTVHSN